MEEILKALLGGASDNSGQQQTNSNQVIIDLLGQVLGGGNAPQAQPASPVQQEANPIADLIGQILGGGNMPAQPQAQPAQQAENPMADLIGGLIGGGSQQASGNAIADLLGGILGGSSSSPQAINPIAQLLVDKIGLSPAIAQAVVAFFMAKMVEIVSQRLTGTQPALPQGAAPQIEDGGGRLNLDNLLSNVHDDQSLNLQLSASGLPQELASQTGLDEETASQSLQEVVKFMAQQKQPAEPAPPQSGGLDNLLDSWETE